MAVTSWLPELLDLAYSTGRRISAICELRVADVRPDVQPHGALVWRMQSDKEEQESVVQINALARAALDRIAVDRVMGTRSRWPESPWLFPSPRNPSRPVSKDLASDWLERAEALAGLPKLDGTLWHGYRRGWATARKHLPIADVAAVGGWKTLEVLSESYQQADDDTSLRVVLNPPENRKF